LTDDLWTIARDRIRRRRNFVTHLIAHVVGSVFLMLVWATTEYHNAGGWPTGFRTGRQNHDWDPWIMYPLIAGTLAVAIHAWVALGRRLLTEGDIRREVSRIEGQV
jgi:2TM domain